MFCKPFSSKLFVYFDAIFFGIIMISTLFHIVCVITYIETLQKVIPWQGKIAGIKNILMNF